MSKTVKKNTTFNIVAVLKDGNTVQLKTLDWNESRTGLFNNSVKVEISEIYKNGGLFLLDKGGRTEKVYLVGQIDHIEVEKAKGKRK